MPKLFSVFLPFLCLLAFFSPDIASADMYKYTDSHGVVSMTNRLESVPARYRSKMTVIKEATAKKDQAPPEAAQPQAPAVDDAAQQQPNAPQSDFAAARKYQELAQTYPWFRPLSYVALALAGFLIVNKISCLLPSRLLSRAISFAFFAGLFAFLFKSYSAHLVDTSHKLKEDATAIVKKSQARQQSLPPDQELPPNPADRTPVR